MDDSSSPETGTSGGKKHKRHHRKHGEENEKDEDAEAEADKMSKEYGVEKEEFLKHFGGLEVVKYDLRMRKALEILGE